jgi:heat shock protein HslJ
VLAYNNGNQAVVSVILDTQITAVFGDDGSISRSGGGNDYTGPYETEDQRIAIGPVAATKQLCDSPGGIDDQEAAYLAALESAELWVIRGDILELRRDDGALAVSLRPAG